MEYQESNKKFCFVYCGDDRCNCGANMRAWNMLRESRRQLQQMNKAELQELEHLDGTQI